jgi:hypothetical protein
MQGIKDRTEELYDDYVPFRRRKYKLMHIKNLLKLFVDYHKKEKSHKRTEPYFTLTTFALLG